MIRSGRKDRGMRKILIVIDMQNDFIDGALGTKEAEGIVEAVAEKIRARKDLMGLNTRCAEWNYMFGWVLMHLSELDKACIYLSIAAHQQPDSVKYARALQEAQRLVASPSRLERLLRWRG